MAAICENYWLQFIAPDESTDWTTKKLLDKQRKSIDGGLFANGGQSYKQNWELADQKVLSGSALGQK